MAHITRDDVAKLAGVAPTTVSNVLNNKGNVSEILTDRVLKAIKELNYTPNIVARSLMTKSSKQIGLIMEDITNPHFAQMAKGAEYEASHRGYVLSVNFASKTIDEIVEDYISRHVDGIVFNAYSGLLSQAVIEKLDRSGIVCVRCGDMSNINFHFIGIDYFEGMKKAYSYLNSKGHRNICYISGQDMELARELRAQAFVWCCNHYGNNFKEGYIVYGKPPFQTDIDAGYEYCRELYTRKQDFTAILVANDYMALGVIKYLRERDVEIPEEVSILSFDNSVFSDCSRPCLTSVGADVTLLGRRAVQKIINIQNGEDEPLEEWLEMQVYEKGSVKVLNI